MRVIAHRGLPPSHQGIGDNSLTAIERALRLGLDIETDLRFVGSQVVISHDNPPAAAGLPTLRDFFDLLRQHPDARAWLNVKCCGMAPAIHAEAKDAQVLDRVCAFDFAVPDLVSAMRTTPGLRLASRQSPYERSVKVDGRYPGAIWLDRWDVDLTVSSWIEKIRLYEKATEKSGAWIAFVSPEVHHPECEFNYPAIGWETRKSQRISVLTDLPAQYDPRIVVTS